LQHPIANNSVALHFALCVYSVREVSKSKAAFNCRTMKHINDFREDLKNLPDVQSVNSLFGEIVSALESFCLCLAVFFVQDRRN
jgi:hypothetical protein